MRTRQRILDVVPALFAILVVAPLAVMMFDRRPVLEIVNSQIANLTPKEITFQWTARELRPDCHGTVQRSWEVGAYTVYSDERTTAPHDPYTGPELQTFRRTYQLPIGVVGKVHTTAVIYRWCNPIQQLWPMKERGLEFTFMVPGPPPAASPTPAK